MKRIFCVVLLLGIVISLSGCCGIGNSGASSSPVTFQGSACDSTTGYYKNKCYGCAALEHNDLSICERLPTSDNADTCYLVAAVGGSACNGLHGKGEEACDRIHDNDALGGCYLAIS